MSAAPEACARALPRIVPMTRQDVDAVLRIEQAAYTFPWTRGNFIDSLAAGHVCEMLCGPQLQFHDTVLGYFVVLPGFEEMHLLNLTVSPIEQSRGLGQLLLAAIVRRCQRGAAQALWLEVRRGNHRARQIYERFGFETMGIRKGYYPQALGAREDALLMRLKIESTSQGAQHGLE
jgi:[ribosomal protein S18]-alanine N-acetyltransferase